MFSGEGEVIGGVTLAVALGLLAGKFLGIYSFTWLAVKSGLTPMPLGMNWKNISGVALLGGIGFTVSLFIANLSFGSAHPVLLNQAKLGVRKIFRLNGTRLPNRLSTPKEKAISVAIGIASPCPPSVPGAQTME